MYSFCPLQTAALALLISSPRAALFCYAPIARLLSPSPGILVCPLTQHLALELASMLDITTFRPVFLHTPPEDHVPARTCARACTPTRFCNGHRCRLLGSSTHIVSFDPVRGGVILHPTVTRDPTEVQRGEDVMFPRERLTLLPQSPRSSHLARICRTGANTDGASSVCQDHGLINSISSIITCSPRRLF